MSNHSGSTGRRRHRRAGLLLPTGLGVLAFLVAGVGSTPPAYAVPAVSPHTANAHADAAELPTAATGYTYWAYFTWDDSSSAWAYATVGPNDKTVKPADGDVYGFRWGLHVGAKGRQPRADGSFDAICGSAGSGPHVAFVLDYGTAEDAREGDEPPPAQGVCAEQRDGFTVQQTLQSVVTVRTGEAALLCAIDDYPSSGCIDTVKNVSKPPPDQPVELVLPGDSSSGDTISPSDTDTDTDTADSDDNSDKVLTIGVPILVVIALGIGALVLRRRRD